MKTFLLTIGFVSLGVISQAKTLEIKEKTTTKTELKSKTKIKKIELVINYTTSCGTQHVINYNSAYDHWTCILNEMSA